MPTSKMAAVLLSVLSVCILFAPVHNLVCRVGWHYFGGSCYGFGDTLVNWGNAQAICKAFNGKLAEIETAEENDFVKNIARSNHAHYTFLGGSDIFEEGVWQWASMGNTIYPFLDWLSGEPNNSGEQDCLVFTSNNNYKWGDIQCNNLCKFICETKSTEAEIVG